MVSTKASGFGTARSRSLSFPDADRRDPRDESVVLITGFGRFPGVERNASAELAMELARRSPPRHPDLRFVADVLPVDWRLAPVQLDKLLTQHRPAVALHFGISSRATGFVIETCAYNETKDLPDEAGQKAGMAFVVARDRLQRSATLPVRQILRHLQSAGFPAEMSSDPGRYLCNAVLFHSLRHAARTNPRMRSGFIHIPAALEPETPGASSLIGWQDAIDGGLQLLDACVATLRSRRASLS